MEKFYADDIKAIDKKIDELKTIKRGLGEKQRVAFLEEAKHFVGKCYRYVGKNAYFKIIDTPQVEYTLSGSIFNQYNFPAFFIDADETEDIPFFTDNIYLDIEDGTPEKKPLSEICVEEVSSKDYALVFQEEISKLTKKFKI